MTVGAGYNVEFNSKGRSNEVSVVLIIEFSEGVSLDEFLVAVLDVSSFFSMITAHFESPKDIRISRFRLAEWRRLLDDGVHPEFHQAFYTWANELPRVRSQYDRKPLIRLHDEQDRASFEAAIASWLGRQDKWRDSSGLMSDCLSLRNRMDSSRVIGACRWLEQTPNAKPIATLSLSQIKQIAKVAAAEAARNNIDVAEARIVGALRSISKESHEQ